jgi:hypothetical protein
MEWNGKESKGREIGKEASRDESWYFRIFNLSYPRKDGTFFR